MPLSLLSGTFYSITRLPETMQIFSYFNPFFYLIDGFRYGFLGGADSNLVSGVGFTLLLNIALALSVYLVIRSGYKLKT
jgi:ABC-2 type transport system permease protein